MSSSSNEEGISSLWLSFAWNELVAASVGAEACTFWSIWPTLSGSRKGVIGFAATGCCGEGTSGSTRFSTGTLPPNRELVSDGATFPVDGVTDVTGGGVDGRDGEEPNRS